MSKVLNIILTIVVIILISYIVYDKVIDKEYVDLKTINTSNKKESDNVKYYSFSKDNINKSIYLFNDNRYYYSISNNNTCSSWSIGQYAIKDNKVTLAEKYHSNCDNCYYTDNLKIYTFNYSEDKIILDSKEILTASNALILPIIDVELIDGIRNCTE